MKKDESVRFISVDTEEINKAAINLYSKFGFIATNNYFNYYQGGTSGIRLKLYLK